VNPPAPPAVGIRTETSSATVSPTPNNADPVEMQEGSLQSNEQTMQALGEGDKVSHKPKEDRLTKAHPFNGDVRNLPHRKPSKRERPERDEPVLIQVCIRARRARP
jgi:hypothetical protein